MLTSTFDDTYEPIQPRTGTLEDEAVLFRRMGDRDRKPAWIALAAAVAVVGVAAATLMLTAGPGRQAAPTDPATTIAARDTSIQTASPPPMETASLTTTVDPSQPLAEPLARVEPAPAARPAARRVPRAVEQPAERVTAAPVEAPAQSAPAAPAASIVQTPPAVETPVAVQPAAPAESVPADAPQIESTPPASPNEPTP